MLLYRNIPTFDISNITTNSDRIYLELPTYTSAASGNAIHDRNYSLTIYDTADNSEYTSADTYSTTIGNNSVVIGNKVGKVTNNDIFYAGYNHVAPASNYYTGLRSDITEYIKDMKNQGKDTVTICVGVDDPADPEQFDNGGNLYFGTTAPTSSTNWNKFKLVPVSFRK